jgi:hypothetical protein
MSTSGKMLRHPVNGASEETWDGFNWPAFFFGVIWLLVKGLYSHFFISLIILVITAGFAAPIVWIAYGFIGNETHKSSLLKKGYLTNGQWEEKNKTHAVSQQAIQPQVRDNLSQLRELSELRDKGVLTEQEFSLQKAKILAQQ